MNGVRRAPTPSGNPAGAEASGQADRRGRFWVLEGIDGSGKTEQARRLADWLRRAGRELVETREPTDGPWGRCYRAWARGEREASPEEVLRYFLEDRREHVAALIAPALHRGADVVCDRYRASTLAYQAAQGLDRERLCRIFASAEFPEPDLELWLRLPVAVAEERLGGARERFEEVEFLERVDAEYARLGLCEIDAVGTPEAVHARIIARVQAVEAVRDRRGRTY